MTGERLFGLIGGIVCHRLPARTLVLGGFALPVCARCTGIYAGFFTAAVFLLLRRRLHGDKVFSVACGILLAALLTPMMLDGISSALGLRATTNTIRLVTGILFGVCLPPLLILAYRFEPSAENTNIILTGKELAVLPFGVLILLAAVQNAGVAGWFFTGAALCLAIITLFTCIFFIVHKRLWRGILKKG